FAMGWGTTLSVKEPAINTAGDMAFWNRIDRADATAHFTVILRQNGYPYQIAQDLYGFVGGNGQLVYSDTFAIALSDSGMMAFRSAINGDGTTTSNAGMFTAVRWQAPQGFALQLKPYLGGTQTYNTFNAPLITP